MEWKNGMGAPARQRVVQARKAMVVRGLAEISATVVIIV